MGVSGHAFRIQVSVKGLCPSSPHPMLGRQTSGRAFAAVPIEWNTIEAGTAGSAIAEHAVQAVEEVVDRGLPVLAIGEDTDLVVGHLHDHLVARTADSQEEGYSALNHWPHNFMLPQRRSQPVPPIQQIREGLEAAVQDWDAADEAKGYLTGSAAYADWRAKLSEEVIENLSIDTKWQYQHGNAYIMECLIDARRTAVAFLRRVQNTLGANAKPHLLAAADIYERLLNETLTLPDFASYAPYSWMCDQDHQWDAEKRQDEIGRLEIAERADSEAMEKIRQALEAHRQSTAAH